MCLKLCAWGFRQYQQDYWNYLDGILVSLGMGRLVFTKHTKQCV